MRLEHELLFAAVRAARDPHRAARCVELAQLAPFVVTFGGQGEIELEIAGDVRALGIGAERAKALRVASPCAAIARRSRALRGTADRNGV